MESFIRETLQKIGETSPLRIIQPVSGGDINESFYADTDNRPYFIKINQHVAPHFFQAEAEGLQRIKETGTVRVPEVYHYDSPEKGEKATLVMEWIEQGNLKQSLGKRLALMHQTTESKFGFGTPTFVGELDQPNNWCETWTDYYSQYRLGSQLSIGMTRGTMKGKRKERLEKLIERLHDFLPAHPKASLLHGDLWGGNWIADKAGEPVLIDPSVLYGDHAFELAFTELFGGFPADFMKEYQSQFELPVDYQDTKPLYQLFYLLVHLNLFGEMYGSQVDRILKTYVG